MIRQSPLFRSSCRVLPGGLAALVLWGGVGTSGAAAPPGRTSSPRSDPAALFARFGCTLCHAPGARYHETIRKAPSRSVEELARWIRNPEQLAPGTDMPTYATVIDEPTALLLAAWLKDAGPGAPTRP